MIESMTDFLDMPVTERGEQATWSLQIQKPEPTRFALALSNGSGRSWKATGHDVFDALMNLRLSAEQDDVQICCNGARPNAAVSGMLGEARQGYVVYLLGEPGDPRSGLPPVADTLGPAPAAEVVSVAEQRAFFEAFAPPPPPGSDAGHTP
jgi:hypothetical protein